MNIKDLRKKVNLLNEQDSFLITVTFFDGQKKGKELDTYVILNKFPYAEMPGTKEMISRLIDKEMKKRRLA